MENIIGVIGVLAWSENRWGGFDRKGYENRQKYGFDFVKNTGIAHEWWNFYDDFDEKFYFGHIETGGKELTQFREGLIIFISRNVYNDKWYFVGFYGKGKYNPSQFATGIKLAELIPKDIKEDLRERLRRNEIQKYQDYVKGVLNDDTEYKGFFRGEKQYSAIFVSEGYIEITPDAIGVKQIGQMSFTYIDTDKEDKIRDLLLKAKQRHEELLKSSDISEEQASEIQEITERIDWVLIKYFSEIKDDVKIDEKMLKQALLELKEEYENYWKKNSSKVLNVYREFLDRVLDGQDPFTIEKELFGNKYKDLLENYKDINRLFWFFWGVGRPKWEENDIEKFREFLRTLKNAKTEEEAKDALSKYRDLKGLNLVSLNIWGSILHPQWFVPLWWDWNRGIINKHNVTIIGIEHLVRETSKGTPTIYLKDFYNVLPEISEKIKKAAREVGIENMAEAAFYLSKYQNKEGFKPPEGEEDEQLEEMKNKIYTILEFKKQIILYGPPGTGKTWLAGEYIKSETGDDREYYEFVTFHPSYSYEEFVEGLKPVPAGNGVKFVVEDGIFKKMAIKAICKALMEKGKASEIVSDILDSMAKIEKGEGSYEEYSKVKRELWDYISGLTEEELREIFSEAPKFYLLIDEINRGDISKIFGELITQLEADKRLGGENQIFVTLAYSKEPFAVPPNLYIIGTMNTADRSIALIDVALRRRFGFIEVMPSYRVLLKELLDNEVESEKQAIEGIKRWEPENLDENNPEDIKKLAIRVLYSINERIKKLYDRDHQIGHSYLLKLKEAEDRDSTIRMLRFIWYHEILPLLQEYFYDSPEKLKKVVKDFADVSDNYFEFKEFEEDSEFLQNLKKVAETSD